MTVQQVTQEDRLVLEAYTAMMIADQIGSGSYRRVYACRYDPNLVIKVEYFGREFCNVAEMQAWRAVQHTPIEDWFAPCENIDGLGLVLLQKRTQPFESEKHFREALIKTRGTAAMPEFFDDVHFGNFGMLEGRVVCHDYGFNHFVKHGVTEGWRKLAHEEGQYALGL